MSSTPLAGPSWLIDDVLRVEDLLVGTAGASPHPLVSEPSLHLLKAGGKRVRPALVLIAARFGEPTPATDLAAAAIELVHLATLYHDDVIDETDTRRGVPTAHAKWGIDVAVLAGDYLFARGCALGADAGGEVPGILARAISEVCEGQIIETGALGDPRRTVDDYLDTIRMKTAALFRSACELGAATAGVPPAERGALIAYGERLGLAFQIVDDLLDIVGDPSVTGKVLGTDLSEGVFTMPVLLAAARDPELAERLARGERDLARVLPLLRESGALRDSLDAAVRLGDEARTHLEDLRAGPQTEVLATMIQGVIAQIEPAAAV